MIRALVIAAGAATLLGACTVSNDPYYGRGTYYSPSGSGYHSDSGYYSGPRYSSPGYYNYSGYQGGYYDRWGNWHSYR